MQPFASLGGALSAGPGGHRSRYDLSDSDDNDMVEEAEEVEEVGGCDDREATAAAVTAAAKAVQAAAAATWKQYLSGDISVKRQAGRGATSAASGARLDSSRTAAHLAFSDAACGPSSTPNLPAVIAGFAANIATLLPMMNGLIASHPAGTTSSEKWAEEWARVSESAVFLSSDTVRKMFTHKKAKGWKRHRGTPSLLREPIRLEGGVVVCGLCKQQLAYKEKTMVSVLKHFLARPHMAHADNAADGRQRNMMRTQETLAAVKLLNNSCCARCRTTRKTKTAEAVAPAV